MFLSYGGQDNSWKLTLEYHLIVLKSIVDILNKNLSDEYVLYTKTRNYHWNVTGIQFNDLHKFFESQYGELDAIIDDVAERNRSLGGKTVATLLNL